ncbi:Crp/Fnr family transcriptional regulator [Oscillatoria sp. FACHB-1407]|uniref:Crp/Fnr family transcriptional regulator n=1 Tax=Oscillatoria sp. FACHB-1407 TaxID=2692847 RepID=UPI001688A62F|nr:Crp/Fnr family transcriptional regulator [Oscillatoria sp. FACHB-1407]MBD2465627.1 Crp/Fnr family transcriptional regulator [Oscillatoria sp. FACHB-1407]
MPHSFALDAASQPDLRQLLEELYQGRSLYPFSSGQPIEMLPHEIWVVCRGVVQLGTLYDTGDEALLGLACPSMPFGLPLTLIRPYQAIALSDVDLMRLSMAEVEQSPMLAQGIFRHLTRRLRQTEAILAMVGYRRVEERLRHLLLLLQEEVGHPVPDGTRLGVRLTHQQLANAIGTTRVTVTRLINQLREEGWLQIDRNRYIIIPAHSKMAI